MSFQMYVEVGVSDTRIAAAMGDDDEFAVNVLMAVAAEVSPGDLSDSLNEQSDLTNLHTFAVALVRVVEEAMA